VPTAGVEVSITSTLGSTAGLISGCKEEAGTSGQNFHRIGRSRARSTKPKGLIVKDIARGVALFGNNCKKPNVRAFFKFLVVEIEDFKLEYFIFYILLFHKTKRPINKPLLKISMRGIGFEPMK
jgi:hypothetical protein